MPEEVLSESEGTSEKSELEMLKSSKDRILNESKEYKAKLKEASERLAALEKAKLEQDGNLQALLESERKKREEVEGKFSGLRKELLATKLKDTFARHAKDALDIDDLIANPITKTTVEFDTDSLDIDEDSVKKAIDALREKKPHYFETKKPKAQANTTPTASVPEPKKDSKQLLADALSVLVR